MIVLDLAKAKTPPKTAAANYQAALAFEQQKRGATLLKPTPFYDSDTFTMLTSTAHKLGVKTIADLLQLTPLLDRRSAGLSVNILQRLAIGRVGLLIEHPL